MTREDRQIVAAEVATTLQEAFRAWHRAVGRVEGVTEQTHNSLACTEEEAAAPTSPLLLSLGSRRHGYCAAAAAAALPKITDALATLQELLEDECHNYKTFLSRTKSKACPVPSSTSSADEPVDMDEYLTMTAPSRLARVSLLDRCVGTLDHLAVQYEILLSSLESQTFSEDQDDSRKGQLNDTSGSESQVMYDLREYIQALSTNTNDKNASSISMFNM